MASNKILDCLSSVCTVGETLFIGMGLSLRAAVWPVVAYVSAIGCWFVCSLVTILTVLEDNVTLYIPSCRTINCLFDNA